MKLDDAQKFALWLIWFLLILVIFLGIVAYLKEHVESGQRLLL